MLMLAPALQAFHQPKWELGLGLGALSTPIYRGSETRTEYLIPFPYVIYRGDIFRVDRESGISGKLFSSDNVRLDLSLAGSLPVRDSDSGAREDMDELDPLVELGPKLSIDLWRSPDRDQRFGFDIPLRMVLSLGDPLVQDQGWTLSPFFNYRLWQEQGGALNRYSLSAGPIFANRRYHNYFYQVESKFVTPDREAYDPPSGYSGSRVTLSATRNYKQFLFGAFARYDNLNGAAFEDSPLVETRGYFVVGVAFGWILGTSDTMVEHQP